MNNNLPSIYFYISDFDWLSKNMPSSADVYCVELLERGTAGGEITWVLQTYLRLKDQGFPCELVGSMPTEGIVLVHRNSLPFNYRPEPKQLLVCLKADKPARPYAQLHVVQNERETKLLRNSYRITHWTQPGLIPRDPSRGDQFKTVAFFGRKGNLAKELTDPGWVKRLKSIGLEWRFKNCYQWHDYSDVDVSLAVRTFGASCGDWKPPSKLCNAWLAGVPAILGSEPAFQEQRRSELDYIEVNTLQETIHALERLRNDVDLRQAMVKNARIRAQEVKPEKIVEQWCSFLVNVAVPEYECWCKALRISKQVFLQRQYLKVKLNGFSNRWQSLVKNE